MPLYINHLQVGLAKNLTDVIEQIVCRKVMYVTKRKSGYDIETYDRYGNNTDKLCEESIEKRREEIDRRFRLNRCRPQRFKVWIDGEYAMTYPTLDDFLFSLLNVHVLFIDVNGTQIWMETAKKYGTEKRTMALCSESIEYHNQRLKERLEKYFVKRGNV